MFGYIRPLLCEKRPQLKPQYRAYYCGLCRAIRRRHGLAPTLFLQYDTVFLALLLDAVYEGDEELRTCRCLHRCGERRKEYVAGNVSLYYADDVNVALAYFKCRDDWDDERKLSGLFGAALLRPAMRRVEKARPALAEAIKRRLDELRVLEQAGVDGRPQVDPTVDSDMLADCFANLLADVAALAPSPASLRPPSRNLGNDEIADQVRNDWVETRNDVRVDRNDVIDEKVLAPLRWLFYNLGRWIYLIDAWDDRERDRKITVGRAAPLPEGGGRQCRQGGVAPAVCNPFLRDDVTKDDAAFMLYSSLAEAEKALALLPLQRNADLLGNIVVEGCRAMTKEKLKVES
ncbi:MAG: DUF5685 family protein [Clostridiales bacterium]|nr:DUF5685 family protein [Clostridiales bacterium]